MTQKLSMRSRDMEWGYERIETAADRILLWNLPYLKIEDIGVLPQLSCIYFVTSLTGRWGRNILYIGKTQNLKQRFGTKGKHTHKMLDWIKEKEIHDKNYRDFRIYWYEIDVRLLSLLEEIFIRKHRPPLNKRDRIGFEDAA